MKIVLDVKAEIWKKLERGQSVLMWMNYVKERNEIFIIEETRPIQRGG